MISINDKISVIIPIYNEAEKVSASIESVLQQTYTNLEIIIVYKESSDDSYQKIMNFNDSRIKIVNQIENNDPGGARNLGIDNATGNFIGFVECEVIPNDYFEKHIKTLVQNDADISFCKIARYDGENFIQNYKLPSKTTITKLIDKIELLTNGASFNKLFKAEIIKENNVRFAENLRWEDNPFLLQALYYADKVVLVEDLTYDYRPAQWSENYRIILQNSIADISRIMFNFAEKNKFSLKEKLRLRYMMFKSYVAGFASNKDIMKEFYSIVGFSPYIWYRCIKRSIK